MFPTLRGSPITISSHSLFPLPAVPGNHESIVCLYGLACSEHFAQVGSYDNVSVWLLSYSIMFSSLIYIITHISTSFPLPFFGGIIHLTQNSLL